MPSDKSRFLRVGVTGGIGSGKSALCNAFREKGRLVLSADMIAHEISDTDEDVKRKIRAVFGVDAYLPDGRLDRKKMADSVFGHPALRKRLNAIIHPRVTEAINDRLGAIPQPKGEPYIIIEAALIYESGMDKELDYTIVIDAPEEDRIGRVMARDGCTRDQVLRRIEAQLPVESKLKRADFVIHNDGREDDLKEKAAFLDTVLCAMRNPTCSS